MKNRNSYIRIQSILLKTRKAAEDLQLMAEYLEQSNNMVITDEMFGYEGETKEFYREHQDYIGDLVDNVVTKTGQLWKVVVEKEGYA